MELNIHTQMLAAVFAIAVVMGAVTNKTNFCANFGSESNETVRQGGVAAWFRSRARGGLWAECRPSSR